MFRSPILILTLFFLACDNAPVVEIPAAQTLTRDANGYYCLMTVVNHKGPKGQIILDDKRVLWFTSVRDTLSFTLSPEEPKNIAAIYVNDMTNAEWDNPGANNWIAAQQAWYVIGSDRSGGMGAPEAVPFSTQSKAEQFSSRHGGEVYAYAAIPSSYILNTAP